MFKFFNKKNQDILEVAQKQLIENMHIFESLKDYDGGKKDIPTDKLEKHLSNLHATL
jgi:hypothetical protein